MGLRGPHRGPLRVQLLAAFERLNHVHGPVTYLDAMAEIPGLHPKSPADRHMVSCTVSEMRRAGELVFDGTRAANSSKTGTGRPMNRWLVATDWRCRKESAGADLAKVFAGWGPAVDRED